MTPEQMRELALDAVMAAENADRRSQTGHALRYRKMAAALRTAADQLEAVQELHRWLRKNIGSPALHARLDQFTADTAPQEERMSKCDWPKCSGYPKSVEKHEIESGPELHPQCRDAIWLAERARREGWHTATQEDRDE